MVNDELESFWEGFGHQCSEGVQSEDGYSGYYDGGSREHSEGIDVGDEVVEILLLVVVEDLFDIIRGIDERQHLLLDCSQHVISVDVPFVEWDLIVVEVVEYLGDSDEFHNGHVPVLPVVITA